MSSNTYNTSRNELLGNSNNSKPGGGRTWGAAPRDTPQTEHLDNRQLLQMQKDTMQEQDQVLDILADSIGRQKEIALNIGKEVDEHNLLLDELDSKVSSTDSKIRAASRRVTRVAKASSTGIMWTVICILVLALIVVGFLAIYL
eukprot:Phypoly_transcript_23580.p1 GENE.Phypoly_transcript_23580~~Phypoly_transcript_23580.p1  ORF type:complete len:144 (+),score=22.24 Phypoly_transcript_23580:63-494(+)